LNKLSVFLRNLALYLRQSVYIPRHIATSFDCILALTKAYVEGVADFIFRREFIGLRLSKDCIVRLYNKYFVIRRNTNDLNFISPLSESRELQHIMTYARKLRRLTRSRMIVFMDAGAHIGKYSVLLSDLVDMVIALEPDPRNYRTLLFNLKLNHVSNVIPLQVAASSDKGYADLHIDRVHTAHSHLILHNEKRQYHKVSAVKVEMTTLDILEQRLRLNKFDPLYIVKIDVEGHEIHVLKGARNVLRRTMIILVETSYDRLPTVLKLIPKDMQTTIMRYPSTINIVCIRKNLLKT